MKTSTLVLLAALAMGAVTTVALTTPTMAAAACSTCGGGGGAGGGGAGGGGAGGGGGGGGGAPGNPENPGDDGKSSEDDVPAPGEFFTSMKDQVCGEKLGQLRRVTEDAIMGVDAADPIEVIEVCRKRPLASSSTNADGLRAALGANPVIEGELDQEGFEPEEVVGVIVNNGAVVLYVHHKA